MEARLERIEHKLDELAKAFIILAKVEEKLLTIERDRHEAQSRVNELEKKLQQDHESFEHDLAELKKSSEANLVTTTAVNRVFWLIVTAGIGYAVTAAFGIF